MSQVYGKTQQEEYKMEIEETEKFCHGLQQALDPFGLFTIQERLYRNMTDRICQTARAAPYAPILQQLNLESIFGKDSYASAIVVRHSGMLEYCFSSLQLRPHQRVSPPGSGGLPRFRPIIHLQEVLRKNVKPHFWLVPMSAILRILRQQAREMQLPWIKQKSNLEEPSYPRLRFEYLLPALLLSPLYIAFKLLHWSLMETIHHRARIVNEGGQDRGRTPSRDDLAGTISCIHPRSRSNSSDAELDVINSYSSTSEEPETRISTDPVPLNSQCECALANEGDYLLENGSDGGVDEWDDCETSSTED